MKKIIISLLMCSLIIACDETEELETTGGMMGGQTGGDVGGQTGGDVGGQTGGDMGGQTGGDMGGQTGGDMGGQTGGDMGGQTGGDMGGQTGGDMGGQTGGDMGGQTGGDMGGQTGGDMGGEMMMTETGSWSTFTGSFPCVDRSDMYWDDENTGYWGCGTKADGEGFWSTTDGGLTWNQQARINYRVNGMTRGGPDNRLYLSGQFDGGPVAVVNEDNPQLLRAETLFQRGRNAFTSVAQGDSVAVTSDGQILVDSLTGTTIAYYPGNNATGQAWMNDVCTGDDASSYNPSESGWCEMRGVTEELLDNPTATVSQLGALRVHNDRFYAAGRYIADAGKVRLPSQREDALFHMQTIYVQNENQSGEMFDIEVSDTGLIVAAGTNQDDNFPLIFLCDSTQTDCYARDNWTTLELDFFFLDAYWTEPASGSRDGRAVDVSGQTIVAVGNFVPNARGGWALISKDGGLTWEDLTPVLNALNPDQERLPNLYDVKIFENGKIPSCRKHKLYIHTLINEVLKNTWMGCFNQT